jgi:hypothetical protein
MEDMKVDYQKYEYIIWDRLGFQEGETGWTIQINELKMNYFGEVLFTEQDSESLGLEERFSGYDIWGRDTGEMSWNDFLDRFSPTPEIIDRITEVIQTGPHKQEW